MIFIQLGTGGSAARTIFISITLKRTSGTEENMDQAGRASSKTQRLAIDAVRITGTDQSTWNQSVNEIRGPLTLTAA